MARRDRSREEATALTATRRERAPTTSHNAQSTSRRREGAAAERNAAAKELRPNVTPPRGSGKAERATKSASAAPQAAAPQEWRDGDRPREDATALTAARRERAADHVTQR